MKFKNERYKKLIRELIPGFDFEKERKPDEIQSIRKVVTELADRKREEKGENCRFSSIIKKSLSPGVRVMVKGEDSPMTIKSVGRTGYVQFFEKKGSFNPTWIEPIE